MFDRNFLKLYFICGTQDCEYNIDKTKHIIETALKNGVTIFQYREKGEYSLTGEANENFAREIQILCQKYKVPFIIDDDIDLVLKLNADGIHIGQKDEDIENIRKKIPNKIIGLTVSNEDEFSNSKIEMADYLGVGPVYNTFSKKNPAQTIGVSGIKKIRNLTNKPIVAIGGIKKENIKEIIKNGADGVAVISAITKEKNIEKITCDLKNEINLSNFLGQYTF